MNALKPGEFRGVIRKQSRRGSKGAEFSDKKTWPAFVREAQPFLCGDDLEFYPHGGLLRAHRGNCDTGRLRVGYQADQGNRQYTSALRPLSLTKLEKEWLGATVRVKGENSKQTYQVWSLCDPTIFCPRESGVFLVWNQLARPMQISRLVMC